MLEGVAHFRRLVKFQSLKRDRGGSCQETPMTTPEPDTMFQSLKRDRGGSCGGWGETLRSQGQFQSLKRDRGGSC